MNNELNRDSIHQSYSEFQAGHITAFELSERILQSATISDAAITPDIDRRRRIGYPEVVYGEGKPIDALISVVEHLLKEEQHHRERQQAKAKSSRSDSNDQATRVTPSEILVTRISVEQARALGDQFPMVRWNSRARTARVGLNDHPIAPTDLMANNHKAFVAVVTAGTTDGPIAEEARETLAWMGMATVLIEDIGVAGPYRIFPHLDKLRTASAIVVVAGMEGALPSVIAGHVSSPIIAVPTSVGYGANFNGMAALLTMLNSCASNVCVVNIDSGFRGGFMAGLIASKSSV